MIVVILASLFVPLFCWGILRRNKSKVRIAVEITFGALLIISIGLVIGYWKTNQAIDNIPKFSIEELESPVLENEFFSEEMVEEEIVFEDSVLERQVFLIYTVGSSGVDEEESAALNIQTEGRGADGLADAVSVFIKDEERVVSVRIPRDLYSEEYGRKVSEIPNVYNAGALVDVAETYVGVEIDFVVAVNFAAFADAIDALGGIEVDVPNAIRSNNLSSNFEAGPQIFNGARALDYSRIRSGEQFVDGEWVRLDGSDTSRIRRQTEVVDQLFKQLNIDSILNNLDDFENVAVDNIVISDNFNFNFLLEWRRVNEFETYQITGEPTFIDEKSVILVEPEFTRSEISQLIN